MSSMQYERWPTKWTDRQKQASKQTNKQTKSVLSLTSFVPFKDILPFQCHYVSGVFATIFMWLFVFHSILRQHRTKPKCAHYSRTEDKTCGHLDFFIHFHLMLKLLLVFIYYFGMLLWNVYLICVNVSVGDGFKDLFSMYL